jgi:drug/metabolite transporter (DMT)-like permease
MNKFLLAIPAFTDFAMTILNYIALNFLCGSVYQMLKGGSVASTLLFSMFLLNARVNKYQLLGSALSLLGVIVVGISHIIFCHET